MDSYESEPFPCMAKYALDVASDQPQLLAGRSLPSQMSMAATFIEHVQQNADCQREGPAYAQAQIEHYTPC